MTGDIAMKTMNAVGAIVLGLLSMAVWAASPPLSDADRQFLETAHQFILQEAAASHLATSKATTAHVQVFAKQMVEDYVDEHDDVGDLATKVGATLSSEKEMDKDHKAKVQTLTKLSGSEFDRQYVSDEITSHTMAIEAFEKAAAGSGNADIKGWAAKRLPALRQNLQNARSAMAKL